MPAQSAPLLATRRGKLLLLGGRAGDLLGRRGLLVAATALFAAYSNRPISPRPRQPTLTGSEPPAEVL